ncbi:hypothetical protein FRC07_011766 [Ceratobasidium sp. 392]|nr:hypothetical protein FRC07_011766 [Ceratobasidium sp. 392]
MAEDKQCPCCRRMMSARQVYRHIADFQRRLAAELALNGDEDIPGNNAGDEGGAAEPAAQMDLDHLDPGVANLNQGVADLNLDDNGLLGPVDGLLQNPPVGIEIAGWPEPDLEPLNDEDEFSDGEPIDGPDLNPRFVEQEFRPALDPMLEPRLTAEEMRQILEMHLGDLAMEEWAGMFAPRITGRDYRLLSLLATRERTHFSRQTWDDLRLGVCNELDIPSEFVAWRRLRILSGTK